MAKPNSLTTKVRKVIVSKIQPLPDPGEGWCVNCTISDGKTVVIPADGSKQHLAKHAEINLDDHVSLLCRW